MIRRQILLASGLTLMLGTLAGCGGGDGGGSAASTPTVAVTPARPEDQIGGSSFGTAFRADANGEATDPAVGSLPAVDPGRDPQPI